MFSVSATEFSELTEFVNKLKTNTHEKAEFDTIRNWCSERGFLLHFSKSHASSSSSSSSPDIFYTLKYDRAKLTPEQFSTLGRFRSVVFDRDGNICCVAPPKMLTLTEEMNVKEVNSVNSSLSAEELVEGIMVNLFWKNDKWYISTKSCVGELSFDHIIQEEAAAQAAAAAEAVEASEVAGESKAFQKLGVQEILRRRICEVFCLLSGGLDSVPKQYCYSFVVQHPKNQIVNHITVPKLYLVAVYQLSKVGESESDSDSDSDSGVNVVRINRDIFSQNFCGSVSHMPSTLTCVSDNVETDAVESVSFTPHTVADYCKLYASTETRSVSLPGVVFVDKDTGFCYKKRNPKYESVKKRKGMEQKLAAQYLQLRKDRGIDEYLKYHPQHSRAFHQFRERLHEYTQKLYDAYIEHYVKKDAKPLKEYDRELKIHMYKLHYDFYLAKMKETGVFVTKHTVIDYVNQLAPAQQLVCLNATALPVHEVTGSVEGHTHKQFRPYQNTKKPIVRSYQKGDNSTDEKGGFRNSRPSRGGRMVPSLSVQIPNADDTVSGEEGKRRVKGTKSTGSIKVQNQFAGLDVD